jgi:serine/threonine protein phosphatase PrpC
MTDQIFSISQLMEYSAATTTLAGEPESGDRHVVIATQSRVLIAVIDGIGHGSEAAEASRAAVATLERHAEESVISLVQHCHEALRATRGAVMSLAAIDAQDNTLTWLGVGNVEGVLMRADRAAKPARENILMRGGVVGYHLPPLRAMVVPIFARDILIFATDGIRGEFQENLSVDASTEHIASSIRSQHSKGTDDALVLVARYLGGHS